MKFRNSTTGEIVEITMMDENGIDYSADFIEAGNRSEFSWNDDCEMHEAEDGDIQWWIGICAAHEELNSRLSDLRQEYDPEELHEAIKHAFDVDLEDMPGAVNQAIDEWLELQS